MTHQEIFTYIYENKVWGEGSGGGSNPENNTEYISFLQDFLKEKEIKSVIDFGCGDWQFSQLIDWTGIHYVGVDCVESVIESNKEKFPEYKFAFGSFIPKGIEADLLIIKDVFQHWTDDKIAIFLNYNFHSFKYILITNSKGTGHYQHPEVEGIITRPISALDYPLNQYNIQVIKTLDQNLNDIKEISLITKI